jgi:hypothetical protein
MTRLTVDHRPAMPRDSPYKDNKIERGGAGLQYGPRLDPPAEVAGRAAVFHGLCVRDIVRDREAFVPGRGIVAGVVASDAAELKEATREVKEGAARDGDPFR